MITVVDVKKFVNQLSVVCGGMYGDQLARALLKKVNLNFTLFQFDLFNIQTIFKCRKIENNELK